MKLHLPKGLFVAVLAACVATQEVYATGNIGWASSYDGSITVLYVGDTVENNNADATDRAGIGTVSLKEGTTNHIIIESVTVPNSYNTNLEDFRISPDGADNQVATISALNVKNGSDISVGLSGWNSNSFKNLIIDNLNVADAGRATIDIHANQTVTLGNVTGVCTATVADTSTLYISGTNAETNGDLIVNTSGAGDIVLTKNAKLNANDVSKATGNLTIQNATLNIDIGKSNTINLGSFTSWTLDDATIEYHGKSVTFKSVTVKESGANFHVDDMEDYNAIITFEGTTTLEGELNIAQKDLNTGGAWKSTFAIESLSGVGNLNISSGDKTDGTIVNLQGMADYSGDITVKKNGASSYATLNLSGSLNAGKAENATTITAENGAVINVGGGSAGTTTSGKIEFASTINVLSSITNSGDLTLNGISIDSTSGLTSIPAGEAPSYSNGTDGFVAQEYYVVKDSSGTLTANNLNTYTFGGVVLDASLGRYYIDNNSLILSLQGAGDYYVNTQVKAGGEGASAGTGNATGYIINDGGKLTVDGALASGVVNGIRVADAAAAEITLLNQTLSHSQTVTMGDGATVSYILDKTTLNLSKLGHVTNVTSLDLRNGSLVELHSTDSKLGTKENKVQVKLSGDSAISLQNSATSGNDVWADIEIDGAGEIRGTTYGDDKTSVQGTIKGAGTLSLKKDADQYDNSFIVASDISDKNAEEHLKVVVDTGDKGVTLSGNNSYSGGTEIKAGTLTTNHESALGKGTVSVNGGLLKMAADLSLSAMDLLAGTVNNGGHKLDITDTLKVGSGATLAMVGEGTTTVQTLQLEANAKITTQGALNMSNLDMASGATITANEAVTLNGNLTLRGQINMVGNLISSLGNLTSADQKVTLFTGVNTLTLGADTYSSLSRNSMGQVDVSTYFAGVDSGLYSLSFSDGNVYAGLMVPEPATTTLSLLALAGLCARRRRNH